jgi:rhodanese-related sulfurtransferase
MMVRTITREQLWTKITHPEQMVLVEISPLENYDRAHLPRAIHLSEAEISRNAEAELPDKGSQLVVYSDAPGAWGVLRAVRQLEEMGYKEIFYYPGGKDEWLREGLPMDSAMAMIPPPHVAKRAG